MSRKKVFMLVRTWALSFITHYNYTVKQSVVSDGTSTGKCKPNIGKGNSYSAYNNNYMSFFPNDLVILPSPISSDHEVIIEIKVIKLIQFYKQQF